MSKYGIRLLNIQPEPKVWTFEGWNLPWLNKLVEDKLDVVVLSNPFDEKLLYQVDELGDFIEKEGERLLTGFGKEINFFNELVSQGIYTYDDAEGVFKYVGN